MTESKSTSAHRGRKKTARTHRSAKALPDNAPKYKGTIVEDELLRPGGTLLAMLTGRAQELGHSRGEMAEHIGVTYGYVAQLISGHRMPENMSMDVLEACAQYLGVPKLTVLVAAGIVKPEDTQEHPEQIGNTVTAALQFISKDSTFGPLMPPELLSVSASSQLQYFVVRLFEAATHSKLIPGERSVEEILGALGQVEQRRQQLLHAQKASG